LYPFNLINGTRTLAYLQERGWSQSAFGWKSANAHIKRGCVDRVEERERALQEGLRRGLEFAHHAGLRRRAQQVARDRAIEVREAEVGRRLEAERRREAEVRANDNMMHVLKVIIYPVLTIFKTIPGDVTLIRWYMYSGLYTHEVRCPSDNY
jgi:hypothetical protein